MSPLPFIAVLLTTLSAMAGSKADSGTKYWSGPVETPPEIPKVLPTPTPVPLPSATPSATPVSTPLTARRPVAARRNVIEIGGPTPVVRSFSMTVGREIPVPTTYSPARIQNGVVIPATPTSFTTVKTGVTMTNGQMTSTEISGWVDYSTVVNTPAGPAKSKIVQPVIETIKVH